MSGSNDLHGSVWHTLRNDFFNARNFFDREAPAPLRQNLFGARVSGRIFKDKLFWMGNFQVLRERRYQTLQGTAPTERERNGDLSLSRSVLIERPAGVVVVDPFTKIPYPNNLVPKDRFDDFAVKYLSYIPPALNQDLPFGQINRVLTSRQLQNDKYFDFRTDYVMSEKTRTYVRYSWAESDKIFPTLEINYARSAPYDNRNGVIG